METKYSLLLVDDETAILETYSAFFSKRGFDVYTAQNGLKALELLQNNDIDVAIVDLRMPQLSGLEMIEKASELHIDTSFIVLTGHGDKDDAVKGINIGIDGWFEKSSIRMEELHAKVVELAKGISLDEVREILSSIPEDD